MMATMDDAQAPIIDNDHPSLTEEESVASSTDTDAVDEALLSEDESQLADDDKPIKAASTPGDRFAVLGLAIVVALCIAVLSVERSHIVYDDYRGYSSSSSSSVSLDRSLKRSKNNLRGTPDTMVSPCSEQYTEIHYLETQEEFDAFTAEHPHVFVAFLASWCKWSRKMLPEWETFTMQQDAKKDGGLKVVAIDCYTVDYEQNKWFPKDVCQGKNLTAFPSVKWFENGAPLELEANYTYCEHNVEALTNYTDSMWMQIRAAAERKKISSAEDGGSSSSKTANGGELDATTAVAVS